MLPNLDIVKELCQPRGETRKCGLETGIKSPDHKKKGLGVKPNDIKGAKYRGQIMGRDKRQVFNTCCGGRYFYMLLECCDQIRIIKMRMTRR